MRRWIGLIASCALLGACGVPQASRADPPGLIISEDDVGRVEAACARVAQTLTEDAASGRLVSSLENLDATLSTVGADELRRFTEAVSGALPALGDTPLADANLSDVASTLIELSNQLVAAGADGDCGGIGEVAAEFDDHTVAPETTSQRLADARGRWASADLRTYWMELSVGPVPSTDDECGAGGSLVVQVNDGRVEKALDRMAGCEPSDIGSVPLTVEDMFTLVSENLDADVLDVDFEPGLGYPRMIHIQGESGATEVWVMDLQEGTSLIQSAEEILDQLAAASETWAAKGVSSYELVVEIGCFCPDEVRGPFEVTVVDGAMSGVIMNGADVEPGDETFLTVEGLFTTIEKYAYSDEITVTYSEQGYPITIDIDPSRNTVDEELRIDVHNLIISEP